MPLRSPPRDGRFTLHPPTLPLRVGRFETFSTTEWPARHGVRRWVLQPRRLCGPSGGQPGDPVADWPDAAACTALAQAGIRRHVR